MIQKTSWVFTDTNFRAVLQMFSVNQQQRLLLLSFGSAMSFAYSLHYKTLLDERLKQKIAFGLKQILLYNLHTQQNLIQLLILKEHHTILYMLHTHKIDIILIFHAFKYFQMLNHFVVNPNLYIQHNTLIFS